MSPKYFLPILMVLVLAGAGCSGNKPNQNSSDQNASTTAINGAKDDDMAKDTALSNPATVYCLSQGGKFSMRKALDGSTEGYCELQNNIQCEEWAYYRGDCPTGAKQAKSATSTSENATTTTAITQATTAQPEPSIQDSAIKPNPEPYPGLKLGLTAEPGEPGEIIVKWTMNGIKSTDGFLVMLSGTPNAGGYGKYNHELGNPASRSFTWTDLVAGRTYYFRVCTYERPDCIKWSDEVSAVAE